jgi:hypothetical protein
LSTARRPQCVLGGQSLTPTDLTTVPCFIAPNALFTNSSVAAPSHAALVHNRRPPFMATARHTDRHLSSRVCRPQMAACTRLSAPIMAAITCPALAPPSGLALQHSTATASRRIRLISQQRPLQSTPATTGEYPPTAASLTHRHFPIARSCSAFMRNAGMHNLCKYEDAAEKCGAQIPLLVLESPV